MPSSSPLHRPLARAALACLALSASAHRAARAQRLPEVRYRLAVAAGDTTGFEVEMRVRHAPRTFRIAMARHPEYDDRFWRFVEGMRAETPGAAVAREDSAVWRVTARGGEATLRWRVRPPPSPPPRAAWRPFLAPTGALVGGPHSFPYVVGAERAPATVTLELPAGWTVATALRAAGSGAYRAADAAALVESPILAGRLREWRFDVDGVAHRVAYWPRPDAVPFDTLAFVDGARRMARQAVALFGRMPYREYDFLVLDGAYGALEHPASLTIGAPSERLAQDAHAVLPELAHEFVHTWNLMSIRPAEYRAVDWRAIEPVPVLWFSEGLSMFYADLLLRRAGLPTEDSTRLDHLRGLLERYLENPAYARLSPETISRAEYAGGPEALGDYTASSHLVGELLGTALDLVVRDATAGRRSMDDVMRLMFARFAGATRGFTGADVERAVHDACGCDVAALFAEHVRAARPLDFDRYLALVGLRLEARRAPVQREGAPLPDLRVRGWMPASDSVLRLSLVTPASAWGRAGLHTGDRVLAVNGTPTRSWPELRGAVSRLRVGDTVRVEVVPRGGGAPRAVVFPMTGYERTVVTLAERADATPRQRALRAAWLAGR